MTSKRENSNGNNASQQISHARDWMPNDADNPRNFSLLRRTLSTLAVTSLAFVSTFGGSIYTTGIPQVMKEFDVSEELAVLPLSLFTAGLAFGPLISAPLCEAFGRKVVFLVTTPVFAAFTLGAGFSRSIIALNITRFFAGLFAAPAPANASATIIDYTVGQHRAIAMSFYYAVPPFGAAFGPVIGGLVMKSTKDWRWTQYTTVIFIAAFYLPIVIYVKESYKIIILQRRAARLGIEGPAQEKCTAAQFFKHFLTMQLIRPLHMLATEPIVTYVSLYHGFLVSIMYAFIVALPWVYEHYYDFPPIDQDLAFLALALGTGLAPVLLILFDHYYYQPRLKEFQQYGVIPPEKRLPAAMIAAPILPAALFGFAWTARPEIHWIVPMLFQILSGMANLSIYAPVSLYMMDTYGPLYGASAAGAAMFSRFAMSAAFPLFTLKMYRALGVGWATSMLAFIFLLLAPIPWAFWRWGERMRRRVRYQISD